MTGASGAPPRPYITAAFLGFVGALLSIGGAWLLLLGGSAYYLLAGAALIACAVWLARGSVNGLRLYWAVLFATILWALAEVGLDGWKLMPRVAGPIIVGLWLSAPFARRGLGGIAPAPFFRSPRAFALSSGVLTAVLGGVTLLLTPATHLSTAAATAPADASAQMGWPQVGGDMHGVRHSAADQITPANVSQLEVAWRFNTGITSATFEATPLVVGDTLFTCTATDVVIALNAETGREIWRYDPHTDTTGHVNVACRGVAYVADADATCPRRVFVATIDATLIALNADNGAPCKTFGENGVVLLMAGVGPRLKGFYYATSPPIVVSDRVILGAHVKDNQSTMAPSGVIRAFDAHTGALRWAWDMGRPDRTGAPPPNETYTPGTPNSWSLFSADEALGLVYAPLGNPNPDFWGQARRPFDERYGSAIVALDVKTGRPRWSFQTTHHDLWDYDLPSQPVLVDIVVGGRGRAALIQATKRGDIFVLDRRNGAPLLPVAERAAPQAGAARGEPVSATQPYSALSLRPDDLKESDMWGLTPLDHLLCRIRFRMMRYNGMFTPPGPTESLQYPGAYGVMNWGGISIDPQRSILIANTTAIASVNQLVPRKNAPPFARRISTSIDYSWGPQEKTPYVIHTRTFGTRARVPCTAPPWGKLTAIDLSTGAVLWSHPLGTAREEGPFNVASHLPFTIGTPNAGGAITTASGLTFIGASMDGYLRAFDSRTGAELWRASLPAAAHATPATYVSKSKRQYVVVAAGGHIGLSPRLGDELIAFALPRSGQ